MILLWLFNRYKRFRSTLVVFWVAANFIYAGAILMVESLYVITNQQFNAVSVYGVILTVIIGILFGYRFVGSISYQVVLNTKNYQQIIKFVKYLQKYHSKTGRRRLFKTIAKDPTIKKTTFE